MDMLLATGEQVTIALLAMALQALGHPARSFTGPAGRHASPTTAHTKARIKRITAERIARRARRGRDRGGGGLPGA